MNRQKKRKFIYHCEKYCVIGYYLSLCRVGMAGGSFVEGRCTYSQALIGGPRFRNKAVSFFS